MASAWIELAPELRGDRAEPLKHKVKEGRVPGDLNSDPLALRPTLEGISFPLKKLPSRR